ncbi:hypothetical protein BB561_004879 [Smittium simulii]|uniref:Acyl-CoA thioesterase II n=1 Tax=Smittium simulii TaxID=133385 RepID=A0A2T9YDS5_9FUNG|nr:hypothetical protein BB561_004879 [Smittium simulii]
MTESLKDQIYKYFFLKEANADIYFTENIYVPTGARGVFGGQVISQALAAATLTVNTRYSSLHSYFVLNGTKGEPIYYHVERIRDGKSFCTRNVLAKQKGNIIFSLSCSFKVFEPNSPEHQFKIPQVESPEFSLSKFTNSNSSTFVGGYKKLKYLSSEKVGRLSMDIYQSISKNEHTRASLDLLDTNTIAERKKSGTGFGDHEVVIPYNVWWFKLSENLENLHPQIHACLLAYISDHRMLTTTNLPHFYGKNYGKNKILMGASLDHAIWFHAPFRVDSWLLYELESPRRVDSRGLVFGKVFDKSGVLVASVAQEGLQRSVPVNPSSETIPSEKLFFKTTPPQNSYENIPSKL